jgi:hypothetical protein
MDLTLLIDQALDDDPDLRTFFLGRLASMAARHAATPSPRERAALSMAMFSIFLDCLDLGIAAEAHAIMSQLSPVADSDRAAA